MSSGVEAHVPRLCAGRGCTASSICDDTALPGAKNSTKRAPVDSFHSVCGIDSGCDYHMVWSSTLSLRTFDIVTWSHILTDALQ